MKKNIELMIHNPSKDYIKGGNTKLICPQDIKPFYESALAKGKKFVD